ncbi:hypothetical protein ABKA04_008030 [Annulohypoxylon sp. FPYF3050]
MAPNNSKSAVAECISDDALIHLKSYKYSAVDKSPVSNYILRPYWNAFVELLPLWLAPNMVTLIGFCFILVNIALLVIVMPDLVGPGPSWLYLSFAFGLFMYQTMDNIDGKQARRTGTSSGLGELFDHGIDSLNCTLGSLLETAAMALGTSKSGVFTALCPCLPMFFSTWETYHTHTLYLGYINGPTEGLLIACSLMAISGIYGPGIWTERIVDLVGTNYLFGAPAQQAPRSPRLPRMDPDGRVHLLNRRMALLPHSTLMRENHLVLFCLTMSLVFGRMTTKMILAHLTRQPFPYWTVMLVPLVGGAVLGNLPRFGLPAITAELEHYYLWAYFVFAFIVYSRWAYLVTTSICNFLGINCLTIPHEKQMENKRKLGLVNGDANGKKSQ